jgi:hypothetical protein
MVESMMSDKVDEDVFNVKGNGEEGRDARREENW